MAPVKGRHVGNFVLPTGWAIVPHHSPSYALTSLQGKDTMTTPKNRKKSVDPELAIRTKLGIWDGSSLGYIAQNITPWVGEDIDGEQIIFRSPQEFMAYAVHDIGRHFARKHMNYSTPGHHKVSVKFSVYRHDNPTVRMENITMTIPYTIAITYDVRGERMDPNALQWVNNIQGNR